MTSDTASQIAYLARVLKAPALRDSAERLAATAREAGWTHQEYLAACLEAEAATRSAHGAENRIRAAGFAARKTIEDFDFDHQRSVRRDHILHLATLDFITAIGNVGYWNRPNTQPASWRGQGTRTLAGDRAAFWPARPARSGSPA